MARKLSVATRAGPAADAPSLVVSEVEGYKLKLSPNNKTGYMNVVQESPGFFVVKIQSGDKHKHFRFGGFATAVAASLWYAQYLAGEDPTQPNGEKAGQPQEAAESLGCHLLVGESLAVA